MFLVYEIRRALVPLAPRSTLAHIEQIVKNPARLTNALRNRRAFHEKAEFVNTFFSSSILSTSSPTNGRRQARPPWEGVLF